MSESLRNVRFFSVGLGRVAEGSTGLWSEGTAVAFVAPAHPRCVERIVLPSSLIRAVEENVIACIGGLTSWSLCADSETLAISAGIFVLS